MQPLYNKYKDFTTNYNKSEIELYKLNSLYATFCTNIILPTVTGSRFIYNKLLSFLKTNKNEA